MQPNRHEEKQSDQKICRFDVPCSGGVLPASAKARAALAKLPRVDRLEPLHKSLQRAQPLFPKGQPT
jgi:hypothetical protein